MTRRIAALIAAASIMVAVNFAHAQQSAKLSQLAYLGLSSPTVVPTRREAFLQGLRDLGHVEGKNLIVDHRWADGKAELLPEFAAELVGLKPDVIFAQAPLETLAAKKATTTIPIVFVNIGDPVAIGVVASLAHPGGNITGLSNLAPELSGKRLELLKESGPISHRSRCSRTARTQVI